MTRYVPACCSRTATTSPPVFLTSPTSGPGIAAGELSFPDGGRDPWRLDGPWTTPLIAVAHGWCMTLGIELLLAADIRIAAAGTRFTSSRCSTGSTLSEGGGRGPATTRRLVPGQFGSEDATEGVRRSFQSSAARPHSPGR